MMDVALYERVSCVLRDETSFDETSASLSRFALARTRDARCFACGGAFSMRTGDFQRCMSCRAENYCPLTDAPAEERLRRWFHRRGIE